VRAHPGARMLVEVGADATGCLVDIGHRESCSLDRLSMRRFATARSSSVCQRRLHSRHVIDVCFVNDSPRTRNKQLSGLRHRRYILIAGISLSRFQS
jgi:hypothetical protein